MAAWARGWQLQYSANPLENIIGLSSNVTNRDKAVYYLQGQPDSSAEKKCLTKGAFLQLITPWTHSFRQRPQEQTWISFSLRHSRDKFNNHAVPTAQYRHSDNNSAFFLTFSETEDVDRCWREAGMIFLSFFFLSHNEIKGQRLNAFFSPGNILISQLKGFNMLIKA